MHLAGDRQSITFTTTIIGINSCWQGLFSTGDPKESPGKPVFRENC